MKNESCTCTYYTRVEELQQIKQATVNSNTSSSDASRPLSHKKGLLPKVLEKLPLLKAKNSIDEISALDEVCINRASKYKLDNEISLLWKMSNGQTRCYICGLSQNDQVHIVKHNKVLYCPCADPIDLKNTLKAQQRQARKERNARHRSKK